MRVLVTGATGLIGRRLVAALRSRGDDVTALSRDPAAARAALGVEAIAWDPTGGPAPLQALDGRDAVVHMAGENVAQRWTARARRAIRESRVVGTRNLVAGLEAAQAGPRVLVSSSGVGYYGPRGDELLEEDAAPGSDFLAGVCREWEAEALAFAGERGARVTCLRTGVVLDRGGGALAKMLPPFRLGVGGPVAGGRQWIPWIHVDDVVGLMLAALDDQRFAGPVNACAPAPATNAEFSRALGRALRRPAVMPVPGLALRARYGEMASIITEGQRAVPARALALGHRFAFEDLGAALAAALA